MSETRDPGPTPPPTGAPDEGLDHSKAAAAGIAFVHPTARAVAMLAEGTGFSWGIFALALTVALSLHGGFGYSTSFVKPKSLEQRVEMAFYKPPPPPPEPPPPEPPPPEPKEKPKPKPKVAKAPPPPEPPPPSNAPPPPVDEPPPPAPPPIVTGISLSSTTKSATGFQIRVGNTLQGDMGKEDFVDPSKVKSYRGGERGGKGKVAKVARAVDVTTKARPVNVPKPRYPKQIRDEGVEGQIVFQVKVGPDGRVKGIKFIKKLHPALDKLAARALLASKWEPATINGKAVSVIERYVFTWDLTG